MTDHLSHIRAQIHQVNAGADVIDELRDSQALVKLLQGELKRANEQRDELTKQIKDSLK